MTVGRGKRHEKINREVANAEKSQTEVGAQLPVPAITKGYLDDLRRARETPITHYVFDEVCDLVAHGHSLMDALSVRGLSLLQWRKCCLGGERAKKWRDTRQAYAQVVMFNAYEHAHDCARRYPGNPGILAAYLKVAERVAKAMDQQTWGDKVNIEARHLVLNTNLPVGAGAVPGSFTVTMRNPNPDPASAQPGGLAPHPLPEQPLFDEEGNAIYPPTSHRDT